jgi:uncharacterized protein (TIGR02594 family)
MTRQEACSRLHDAVSRELGVRECPGPEANPRILEYDRHTSLRATSDEAAWCSALANFVVEGCGFPGTGSAAAASWKDYGVELNEPIRGCLVVWEHHVAFCDHPNVSNGVVRVIGGNQGNAVSVARFSTKGATYRSPV